MDIITAAAAKIVEDDAPYHLLVWGLPHGLES